MKLLIVEVNHQASGEFKREPHVLLTQVVSHSWKCRSPLSNAGAEIRKNEDLTTLIEELVPIPTPKNLFFIAVVVKSHDHYSRPLILPVSRRRGANTVRSIQQRGSGKDFWPEHVLEKLRHERNRIAPFCSLGDADDPEIATPRARFQVLHFIGELLVSRSQL